MTVLFGIAHFTVHEGRPEDVKRLSRRCMEIVQDKDTDTVGYDVFLDADECGAVVIEEYVGAALIGLGGLDDAVRAAFDGRPVRTFAPFLSLR